MPSVTATADTEPTLTAETKSEPTADQVPELIPATDRYGARACSPVHPGMEAYYSV